MRKTPLIVFLLSGDSAAARAEAFDRALARGPSEREVDVTSPSDEVALRVAVFAESRGEDVDRALSRARSEIASGIVAKAFGGKGAPVVSMDVHRGRRFVVVFSGDTPAARALALTNAVETMRAKGARFIDVSVPGTGLRAIFTEVTSEESFDRALAVVVGEVAAGIGSAGAITGDGANWELQIER